VSSSALEIPTAEVYEPLLQPARYKGGWGGRGSGKSHFFAGLAIEDALAEPGLSGEGLRTVCIREVQKDLAQSSKALIERKLSEFGLGEADGFKVFRDVIEAPKGGLFLFKGMQDYTADSIKSLEGFKRAWFEEAQTASARSLELLRPTIRAEGSELWFSWNPRRKTDPVDAMLRGDNLPTGAVVVKANWSDNPWLPSVLEQERQDCLRTNADQYAHIWEGDYQTVMTGAYYAKQIAELKAQGRLCRVARDPLMSMRAFVDIGGAGAKSDSFSIWIAQFVGREIRVLDYYEAQGQPIDAHVNWLRESGYEKAKIFLPHDGAQSDRVYAVSYQSALTQAGFDVTVIPNQGKGAAMARIEAVRRLFPSIWINEPTTQHGMDAIGAYHAKQDEARGIDLGPDHDWASHAADAFGLMAVVFEADKQTARTTQRRFVPVSSGWAA